MAGYMWDFSANPKNNYDPRADASVYLKVIGADNTSIHGGDFDYTEFLPNPNGAPGKWLPMRPVYLCSSGWHWTDPDHLGKWMKPGAKVYVADPFGSIGRGDDKSASSSGRLLAPYVTPIWWEEAAKLVKHMHNMVAPNWIGHTDWSYTGVGERIWEKIGRAKDELRSFAGSADKDVMMLALLLWPHKFTTDEGVYINQRFFIDKEPFYYRSTDPYLFYHK